MSANPLHADELCRRWSDALRAWAIPDHILAQAPTSPWVHPPKLFAVAADAEFPDTPSRLVALEALGVVGGSVLDVGCGGGGSAMPLAERTTHLHGVDEQAAMLRNFEAAAQRAGVAVTTTQGPWREVQAAVPPADVVISHHVAFNVAEIGPFIVSLTEHALGRVIVELPDRHPTSAMSPLWKHFWDLDRPSEPSAALFVDIVTALGYQPELQRFSRPPRKQQLDAAEFVAFVRTRLCLPASRDPEVAEALQTFGLAESTDVATVHWSGSTSPQQ
jgi:2-polyprenyl-3-methyl-5-hydroxy-6-metoxy-1,4-benzoquinol methylase